MKLPWLRVGAMPGAAWEFAMGQACTILGAVLELPMWPPRHLSSGGFRASAFSISVPPAGRFWYSRLGDLGMPVNSKSRTKLDPVLQFRELHVFGFGTVPNPILVRTEIGNMDVRKRPDGRDRTGPKEIPKWHQEWSHSGPITIPKMVPIMGPIRHHTNSQNATKMVPNWSHL